MSAYIKKGLPEQGKIKELCGREDSAVPGVIRALKKLDGLNILYECV